MSVKLSIAPMVNYSHRHFRRLMRFIVPYAMVYTEMQPLEAVLHHRDQVIHFSEAEHPIALQVGGANEMQLLQALHVAEQCGYDELNLNLGCPSHRVQSGHFGAVLMYEGERVAKWIYRLKQVAHIPISIKMRTGVGRDNHYDFLKQVAGLFIEAGVDKLIIHARAVWLTGLNPKQNRHIPPLQYEYVHQLKCDYPQCPMILNGQLNTIDVIQTQLAHSDGVMIGRLACVNPYQLATIHRFLYPDCPILSREEVIEAYMDYARDMQRQGIRKSLLYQPLIHMMHGQQGAKWWRQNVL